MVLKYCGRCKIDVEPKEVKGPFGPHHSKLVCSRCDSYLAWMISSEGKELRIILDYFFDNVDTVDPFILSLKDQYIKKGSLSPKQIKCLKGMKEFNCMGIIPYKPLKDSSYYLYWESTEA